MDGSRPDGCAFRVASATGSSLVIGGIVGAVSATWSEVPKVLKGRAVPAAMATARVMGAYGMTFAAVGGIFAAVDCMAESARGTKDVWNGVYGGAAAGSVLGLRAGKVNVGVGAAAALAAMSAIVDTTGHRVRGSGGFDDGATPQRVHFPTIVQTAYASKSAGAPDGLLSDAEAIKRLYEIKKSHPSNRAAKYFTTEYYDTLSAENKAALLRCVRSGTYNPDSSVGCYAMRPEDYDTLKGFFGPLIADYHGVKPGTKQPSDWNAAAMDLAALGLGPSSSRVRVGRNLASFPLPGAMSKEQRMAMEEVMSKAYAELAKKKMPNGKPFGGRYYSLTPGRPDSISEKEYQQLIKEHLMFKSMDKDPYLKTAGISADWPYGRGTYISDDRRVSIWCNEEDHLRVTVLVPATTSLNEPFDLLNATLKSLESVPGVKFARSSEYGYVTSCPSNLGTGMRASVMIRLPNLTGSDDIYAERAQAIAKPYGLSVRGSGGEHTPVVNHMVDISPSARFGISEGEILKRLFGGIQAIMAEESKAGSK